MIKISRFLKSFIYALRGFLKVLREEQNLKVQIFAAFTVLVVSFLLGLSALEWALIIFAITLVILAEVINSAVERVTDVLKPRIDHYVKEIKDIMAAAVLLSSLSAAIIGVIVMGPRLLSVIFP